MERKARTGGNKRQESADGTRHMSLTFIRLRHKGKTGKNDRTERNGRQERKGDGKARNNQPYPKQCMPYVHAYISRQYTMNTQNNV